MATKDERLEQIKMGEAILDRVDAAVDVLREDAAEYVRTLDEVRIKTTKDSYGRVMELLTRLDGEAAPLFLIAMVREGYPLATAEQLATLYGWSASVPILLRRAYLQVDA